MQGDRLELENLHAGLAEAQTRADALEEIVDFGREAAEKQTQTLVNQMCIRDSTAFCAAVSAARASHSAASSSSAVPRSRVWYWL